MQNELLLSLIHISLIRSIGYDERRQQTKNQNTFTIIRNHYLKDIRGDLMEEEVTKNNNNNSEIAYISAEVNGITTKIMIDTGANVSPVSYTHLDVYKRQVLYILLHIINYSKYHVCVCLC